MNLRSLLLIFALLAPVSAAPLLPPAAVTDGSVSVSTEDIGATSLFYLVLTSGGTSEKYAFHSLDFISSLAIANGRVAMFAEAMADAMGPVTLTFGSGGCAPGSCYQNLHSYDWLPWQSSQIPYPDGYSTLPIATGGGLRFTNFTHSGILSALVRADKTTQSAAGPLYIDVPVSWNVNTGAVIHNPEPATFLLAAGGLGAIWLKLRKRGR